MQTLVTGSNGFIAGYLVAELLEHGHEVVGIDNFGKYGRVSKSSDNHPKYKLVEGDCKGTELMKKLALDCDHFVACAAMIGGMIKFVDEFLHLVAHDMRTQNLHLEVINTWGDSIVGVSKDILHNMHFTDIVRQAIHRINKANEYNKHEINIRIALHAGPVFKVYDPLIRKKSVAGSHIIRAARMEPITIPGSVYASAPFAAY